MRRYLVVIILVVSGCHVFGQNHISESGYVGIGTLTPTSELDVRGNVIWDGFNSGNPRGLKIGYSGGNYGGIGYNIDFISATGIYNRPLIDRSSYLEFTYGGFKFYGTGNSSQASGINLNGGGANLNLFATITSSGNFGIGTDNPLTKFAVSNNGSEGLEIVPGASANSSRIYAINRNGNLYNSLIFNTTDVDFRNESDVSRLFIENSTGNVGIGTSTPTHPLTVNGGMKLIGQNKGLSIEYATLSETLSGASTILGNNVRAGEGNNTIRRTNSPDDPGSYLSLNYYYGITFHTGVRSTLNADVSSLDNEVMRIAQNGNVGIGTTDPRGYKLAVNGNIRAQEIKVEASPWPDYVFAKDYSLPTLQATEKHIKEKGHLPGIPSAEEVKANGIDLGEMNAKLLQKIEELTLHLIEKNKLIDDLAARLKKVETALIK